MVTNPIYPSQSRWLDEKDPKIVCLPWGVDTEIFRPVREMPEGDELVLGFLSLLDTHHRYKGLEVLLRAVAELHGADVPVRLQVGGKGDDQASYRQRAAELGIAGAVEFLGFVPDADLASFYGSCHLFVLPSTDGRREGFGLVLLEAMACGRPVVTTPLVGVAGDLEGAGVLFPPGDASALAAALRRLNEERETLPGMGRRARRLVEEKYTWERVADGYEELFRGLASPLAPGVNPGRGR